ncbi:hypothetical protein BJ684DRAFT_17018, partial [Piptocephalis cylindrospora]
MAHTPGSGERWRHRQSPIHLGYFGAKALQGTRYGYLKRNLMGSGYERIEMEARLVRGADLKEEEMERGEKESIEKEEKERMGREKERKERKEKEGKEKVEKEKKKMEVDEKEVVEEETMEIGEGMEGAKERTNVEMDKGAESIGKEERMSSKRDAEEQLTQLMAEGEDGSKRARKEEEEVKR